MPQDPVKAPQSIRGRPTTKYSKALTKKVCHLLSATGLSIREVYHRVGITPETLYAWKHRYPDFLNKSHARWIGLWAASGTYMVTVAAPVPCGYAYIVSLPCVAGGSASGAVE